MTDLIHAAQELGIAFDSSDTGTWVRFAERNGIMRYVVQSTLADGFLAWEQSNRAHEAEWYLTAEEALDGVHFPRMPRQIDIIPMEAQAMQGVHISRDTFVSDALESVPEAVTLFQRHGTDPTRRCGPAARRVRLDEASEHCHLHDVDGLIAELNRRIREG